MTLEEFRQIPKLKRRIDRDKEQLEYLKEKATSIPCVMPNPNKVQNTVENTAGRYVEAYIDLEREIQAKEAELAKLQARAKAIIEQEPDDLSRRVLLGRYVHIYTWEVIADICGYTVRRVHQIEKKAITRIS